MAILANSPSEDHKELGDIAHVDSLRVSRLLSAEDVAEVLGVPRSMVYTLARRGDLPTVRVGDRYVRFRAEAVEQWIARSETSAPRGTQ